MTYVIIDGQSLVDVAIMCYGSVEGVGWLLLDNPTLQGPAEQLLAGQVLVLRGDVLNPRFVAYLAEYAPLGTLEPTDQAYGIGFDRVGVADVASGVTEAVNMAPLAGIDFSSVNNTFQLAHLIKEANLITPYSWGNTGGWNDGTSGVWPDWVELSWPQPITAYGARISHLTNDLRPGANPTENGGYVLKDFRFEVWNGVAYETALSVADNTKVYTIHEFPHAYTTTRVRVWITATHDIWSRICQLIIMGR